MAGSRDQLSSSSPSDSNPPASTPPCSAVLRTHSHVPVGNPIDETVWPPQVTAAGAMWQPTAGERSALLFQDNVELEQLYTSSDAIRYALGYVRA